MAVGDLYRIAFNYNVWGQSNVNVMYMRQTAPIGDNDAQAVADVLAPAMRDLYTGVVAGIRFLGTQTQVQLVARLATDVGEQFSNFATDGASLGGALPPANAVICRLKTGLAGRTRRGRIFLGGVGQSWHTAGVLNSVGQPIYNQFITNVKANFVGTNPLFNMQLGVFSRTRYKIVSNPFDSYFAPVTDLQVPAAIATMRSRKVGVGA